CSERLLCFSRLFPAIRSDAATGPCEDLRECFRHLSLSLCVCDLDAIYAVADFNACRCKRRDRAKRHTCSELGCQRQREQRSGRRPIDAGRTAGINGRGSVRPEVRARRWLVGINHDPVDEIINPGGDAIDSAEPVVQGWISSAQPSVLLRFLSTPGFLASGYHLEES